MFEPRLVDPSELLTTGAAARIAGVDRRELRRLATTGRIAAGKTANGFYVYRLADLRRLAAERAAR